MQFDAPRLRPAHPSALRFIALLMAVRPSLPFFFFVNSAVSLTVSLQTPFLWSDDYHKSVLTPLFTGITLLSSEAQAILIKWWSA
jgi:hypothetical protein